MLQKGDQSAERANQQPAARGKHVLMMKVFAAITFLFLVSYTPVVLLIVRATHNFHVLYMYFINHIGNPIVYLIFIKQFRADVKEIVMKMKCW